MGLKLKSTNGTGSVELNAPDNHNINTSFTLPTSNFTGGEWVLADGNGNVNIDSGTLYVDAVNDRVGIGTSSPSTNTEINAALDTGAGLALNEGQLSIGREADSGGAIRIGYDTTNNFGFISSGRVGVSWDNLTLNAGGGNVGIGTTSPSSILDIQTSSGNLEVDALGGTSTKIRHTTTGGILALEGHSGIRFDKSSADEMARFDSSGRLLVGTSDTQGASNYYDDLVIKKDGASTGAGITLLGNASTGYAGVVFADPTDAVNGGAIKYSNATDYLWLETAGTERMRIASNGFIFPDTSSANYASSYNSTSVGGFRWLATTATTTVRAESYAASTSTRYHQSFSNPNGVVGFISTLNSATSFNETSDYRLKENVTPISDSISRLKQLKPSRFNFIVDPNITVDGFLAHEVQNIVPEAVTGEKDAVRVWEEDEDLPDGVSVGDNKLDDDGNTIPEYQAIDKSKLVPLLTAALKEAIAKIETLEANNVSLEAKVTALETQNASFEARLAALEGGTTE